ncbi:type I-E CRISPR-associated protein Cas6/Cse3/CasE [Thorsellia kenyensis]|uniref:Type I-E CRISPR-associated protein Cas6/Cse3/CasE n=1 Tax=Thorsellia kenyensis TaxID=1549888 RepID=A0ABV6C737_9GAMM
MFLSRVRINPNLKKLAEHLGSGVSYHSHQLLWKLFSHNEERQFLFRKELVKRGPLAGLIEFYVQSEELPVSNGNQFILETKEYEPKLNVGDKLSFRLRVNPTIKINGKRHDVVMHAKTKLRNSDKLDKVADFDLITQSAIEWITNEIRTQAWGIRFDISPVVLSYQKETIFKESKKQTLSYGVVDFEGVLVVTDVEKFNSTLKNGVGRAKAFGCGLFLIKRL